MNAPVFDWKTIAALGSSVAVILLACKLDSSAAERVFTLGMDALKELVGVLADNH